MQDEIPGDELFRLDQGYLETEKSNLASRYLEDVGIYLDAFSTNLDAFSTNFFDVFSDSIFFDLLNNMVPYSR